MSSDFDHRDYWIAAAIWLRIEGTGRLFDHFVLTFAGLERSDDLSGSPDLVVRVLPGKPRRIGERLTSTNMDVHVEGSGIRLTYRRRHAELARARRMDELTHLIFDEHFDALVADKLVELFLRCKLAGRGVTLIHAAGVVRRDSGSASLYAGSGGSGKTSWAIQHVSTGQFLLLGEDRLWLSVQGDALRYPRYIVLKASDTNRLTLRYFSPMQRARARALHSIARAVRSHAQVTRLVRLLSPRPLHVSPTEIFGTAAVASCGVVRDLRVKDESRRLQESPIEPHVTARLLMDINWAEWDRFLSSIVAQCSSSYASGWSGDFHALRETEQRNLERALVGVHVCGD